MLKQTMRIFELITKNNPNHYYTYYKYAINFNDLGKIKRAIKMFLHVIKLKPQFLKSYIALKAIFTRRIPENKIIMKQINKCSTLVITPMINQTIFQESQKLIKLIKNLKIKKLLQEKKAF